MPLGRKRARALFLPLRLFLSLFFFLFAFRSFVGGRTEWGGSRCGAKQERKAETATKPVEQKKAPAEEKKATEEKKEASKGAVGTLVMKPEEKKEDKPAAPRPQSPKGGSSANMSGTEEKCESCEAKLKPNALFCTKCGSKTARGRGEAGTKSGAASSTSTPTPERKDAPDAGRSPRMGVKPAADDASKSPRMLSKVADDAKRSLSGSRGNIDELQKSPRTAAKGTLEDAKRTIGASKGSIPSLDDSKRREEVARKKAEEEAAKKKAEEEAAAKKQAEEEAARKKREEERKKRAAEEEARKKAEEEAAAKKQAEEEAARRKREEERKKRAAEEEAKRQAEEEAAAAKKQAEEEAARKKREEERKKRAADEDAKRKADEEAAAAKKKADEEAAKKKKADEAAAKKPAVSPREDPADPPTATKKCTQCKANIRIMATFCTKCGTKQAAAGPAPAAATKQQTPVPTIEVRPEVPRDLSPRHQTLTKSPRQTPPMDKSPAARGPRGGVESGGAGKQLTPEQERQARKGSFRESIMIRKDAFRESMVITDEEREAALLRIDDLIGAESGTVDVKLRCVMDGVKKTLVVEALNGIITGRAIQIAWNLSPEQEFHITFTGLRAPNGDEIPFEKSEEIPWAHIPFYEEVLFENEEYEILYEDDRDGDVDKLTAAEVAKLEREFDQMDVKKAGVLTRDGLTQYFTERHLQQKRDREGKVDKILASGVLNRGAKAPMQSNMRLDQEGREWVEEQVENIMGMDISGSGQVQLHEFARAMATEIVLARTMSARQSERGKRMSAIGPRGGGSNNRASILTVAGLRDRK